MLLRFICALFINLLLIYQIICCDLSINCGLRYSFYDFKVVGGTEVDVSVLPWQASIVGRDSPVRKDAVYHHFCGASVIGNKWLATAAHCMNTYNIKNMRVILGTTDLRNVSAVYRIQKAYIHPEYEPKTVKNDIAIVQLTKNINFTRENVPINIVCLPYENSEPQGSAIVSGYGRLKENGEVSKKLRAAVLPIISYEECRRIYGTSIWNKMLCAGYMEGNKDSCQGDSGGPLIQIHSNYRATLVGIVSWGEGCARKRRPGVYTKVSKYVPFIKSIIEAND